MAGGKRDEVMLRLQGIIQSSFIYTWFLLSAFDRKLLDATSTRLEATHYTVYQSSIYIHYYFRIYHSKDVRILNDPV